MLLYQNYTNPAIDQLRREVERTLLLVSARDLDQLLDLTVLKSVLRQTDEAAKSHIVSILRADPNRFVFWLDQQFPSARLAVTEALTRVLLSLTVE